MIQDQDGGGEYVCDNSEVMLSERVETSIYMYVIPRDARKQAWTNAMQNKKRKENKKDKKGKRERKKEK